MAIEIKETIDGAPAGTYGSASGASGGGRATQSTSSPGSKTGTKLKAQNPPDRFIWGIYLALIIISIIELFSASSTEISGTNVYGPLIRHAIFLGLGLAIVLWLQNVPYTYFNRWAYPIGLLSSGLLWINGLTNMLLMMCVSVTLIIIGGIEWRKLMMVFAVYGVAAGFLFMAKYATPSSTEYDKVGAETELVQTANAGGGAGRSETHIGRIRRFIAGVHPQDSLTDKNRQVIFANMAQANGGLIGQGPGNSRESARLPLAFSDYIYSIVVEDTGFVGGAFLLLLYLFLVARAGVIGYRCSRAFPAFLIMGCAVLIVFQALVHMAIVTGVFPVSGQPLPFISKGGTSILVMSAAIGIMLSVSRYAVTSGDKKAIRAETKDLPEELQAINISHE